MTGYWQHPLFGDAILPPEWYLENTDPPATDAVEEPEEITEEPEKETEEPEVITEQPTAEVMQAARLVSMRDITFATYMAKKRAEGKHFNVAQSHVGKKLI
ncbi:MAG: hypothetical protein IIU98_00605, partial [Ruminococcus sp.]|nr:hypothetical protein [Ruminococcus sp.]